MRKSRPAQFYFKVQLIKMEKKQKKHIDITAHKFVPKHEKLNEQESLEVLKKFNISKKQLPIILKKDPVIKNIDTKKGDIIKIYRDSPTLGKSIFYRVVR